MPITLDAYGIPVPGDPVQNVTESVATLAELRAFVTKPAHGDIVTIRGQNAEGDGLGRNYRWVDYSTAADDGYQYVKCTAILSGRFVLFAPGVVTTPAFTVGSLSGHARTVTISSLPPYSAIQIWVSAVALGPIPISPPNGGMVVTTGVVLSGLPCDSSLVVAADATGTVSVSVTEGDQDATPRSFYLNAAAQGQPAVSSPILVFV